MSAEVPQFLFAASSDAPLISGFRTSHDGSLSPVPGSPFSISAPAREIMRMENNLLVVIDTAVILFAIDKESGSLRQMDSLAADHFSVLVPSPSDDVVMGGSQTGPVAMRLANGKLHMRPASQEETALATPVRRVPGAPPAIFDLENPFMYLVDPADRKSVV